MEPKEKAKELIVKFKPNVYCYQGSGMLTNTYDENVATTFAKDCARICVEEMIPLCAAIDGMNPFREDDEPTFIQYWQSVLTHLQ